MRQTSQHGWRLAAKKLFDRVAAALVLLLLSPVLVAIALLVWGTMGWPVLFRQERPGHNGRGFQLIKFRTMSELRDGGGQLLPDAERLTRLGRLLRATSMDELPELWNVLRGELSLVGPRPLLMQYLSRYTPEQARRHEVLPGITGWAQINGRNDLPWEEKFALDLWYVEHWNLALDARILVRTMWRVLRRDGISLPGHATALEFGSPRLVLPGRGATVRHQSGLLGEEHDRGCDT